MSTSPPGTHADTTAIVRGHLDRLGISRKHLAERLGVTPTTVSRWATGATRPAGHTLRALARLRPKVSVNAADLETVTEWFEENALPLSTLAPITPNVTRALTRLRKAAQEKQR